MNVSLSEAQRMDPIVRAVRKAQQLRQDDTAMTLSVSENFLGKVERGNVSVQWGKVFQVLEGLGIEVTLNLPAVTREDEARLRDALRKQGVSVAGPHT
jgi:transcriptional regulator with XRE-family HTH domain